MLDLTNSDGASTNYLINDEFQILASTNHNDLTVLNDPQEMAQITTQDTFQFNQQKYLVQSIPNEELHISVVSVTNPSQALSLVNRVQEHFILIFMCILFVGDHCCYINGDQKLSTDPQNRTFGSRIP